MPAFIDRVYSSINSTGSYLVAGFDPSLAAIPQFIVEESARNSTTDEEFVYQSLSTYLSLALEGAQGHVAAIKPNIAFFEQYGIGGLRAFVRICEAIRDLAIPLIVDAKRGDIGTTAKAYSNAFLGGVPFVGRTFRLVEGDALTVNPYLGFDTLEPFMEDCRASGKGLFVLVKTSNPGSADIQNFGPSPEKNVSQKVCAWISSHADSLTGQCGLSGLGAVVGATYPEEARTIRAAIPKSLFLVPGFGAQGGTAEDAFQGAIGVSGQLYQAGSNPSGVLVNASRGVFQGSAKNKEEFVQLIRSNAKRLSKELTAGAESAVASKSLK